MDRTTGTVCFIVSNGKVLLAEIAYPDGERLWNGIGGVVNSGETPQQAVVREISEETRITVEEADTKEVKVVNIGSLELHIFIAEKWSGELEVLDPTLKQLKWFAYDAVPYLQMHIGNDEWLPGILEQYIT